MLVIIILSTIFTQFGCSNDELPSVDEIIIADLEGSDIRFIDIAKNGKPFIYFSDIICIFCSRSVLNCPVSKRYNVINIGNNVKFSKSVSYVHDIVVYTYINNQITDQLQIILGSTFSTSKSSFPIIVEYSKGNPIEVMRSYEVSMRLGDNEVCKILDDFIVND